MGLVIEVGFGKTSQHRPNRVAQIELRVVLTEAGGQKLIFCVTSTGFIF